MFVVALTLSLSGVVAALLSVAEPALRVRSLVALGAVGVAAALWVTWVRPRRAQVAAGPEGLRVGGASYPRRAMRAGYFLPAQQGMAARVFLQGTPSLTIEVATEREAQALLFALGLLDRARASRFSVVGPEVLGPFARIAAGIVLVASAFLALSVHLVLVLAPVALLVLNEPIVAWLRRRTVDVGVDGILVRRTFGGAFVAASDLTGLEEADGALTLRTTAGPLVLTGAAPTDARARERHDALAARVRALIASRDEAPRAERLLERAGAPISQWLAGLRTRVSDDYRSASLTSDELEHALAKASVPSARVGAAVLLRARGLPTARLRIAAEACAEPHLRAALVAVADEVPDAELEAALAQLDKLEAAESASRVTRVV